MSDDDLRELESMRAKWDATMRSNLELAAEAERLRAAVREIARHIDGPVDTLNEAIERAAALAGEDGACLAVDAAIARAERAEAQELRLAAEVDRLRALLAEARLGTVT